MRNNLILGKAGELRIASELLLRGHEIYLSSVDSGIDLILANGKRIQVKTANKSKHGKKSRAYCFSFKSWRRKEGHYVPHGLNNVDFVILWPVETTDFFIIPSDNIRGKYSIRMVVDISEGSRGGWSEYEQYRNQWEILK